MPRPDGKHNSGSHFEDPVAWDTVEDEAEATRQSKMTMSYKGRVSPTISITNPPSVGITTPTTATSSSNGFPADNTSPKAFTTMGLGRADLSPRYGDGAEENSTEGKRSLPDPTSSTSPASQVIITFDSLHQTSGQSSPLGLLEDQYDAGKFQHRAQVDGHQPPRTRQWKKEAKLPRLRARNLQTRARFFERRSELSEARIEISIADEEYMKLVRAGFVGQSLGDNHSFQDELIRAYKRLQDARNLYGPLEEAYDKLEDLLDRQDFELMRIEEQILKHVPSSVEDRDDDSDSISGDSDKSDISQMVEKVHPLYAQYMSRLGDEDLLREDYADLLFEYGRLQDQEALRQGVQKSLHPDDQITLANFPAEEAKLREEMRVVSVDLERLLGACRAAGLIPEDADDERPKSDGSQREDQIRNHLEQPNDSIDIGETSPAQSEYKRFPFLLEVPIEKPVESPDLSDLSKSNILLTNFEENNPGDRITCWLLHKLRSSCSEVELLVRFSASLDGIDVDASQNTDEWQHQVLHLWFVDSANLPPSVYEVDTRSDGLEINGAVTITLVENRDQFQSRPHLASSSSKTFPPFQSPSAVSLPSSSLSSTIPPNPPVLSPTPSNQLSPPFISHSSSSSILEGVIAIYSQSGAKYDSKTDSHLNPELAKYTTDNTTSQRLQIRALLSNYASFSLSEKTLGKRWSLQREFNVRDLRAGGGVTAAMSGRDVGYQNRSAMRRRALSV